MPSFGRDRHHGRIAQQGIAANHLRRLARHTAAHGVGFGASRKRAGNIRRTAAGYAARLVGRIALHATRVGRISRCDGRYDPGRGHPHRHERNAVTGIRLLGDGSCGICLSFAPGLDRSGNRQSARLDHIGGVYPFEAACRHVGGRTSGAVGTDRSGDFDRRSLHRNPETIADQSARIDADDGIVRGHCLADAGQDIARHDHCGAVGMTGIARGSQRSRRRNRTPGEEELSGGDFSRTTFIRTSMYDHTGYTARIGADFRVTR